MKNLIVTITFLMFSNFVFSQLIEISEAPRAKDNGTYNSFLFEMPDLDKDQVEKDWEKFIKDFKAKTKYNRKSKFHTSEEAQFPQLSDQPINVYARIMEDKNPNKRTSVIVWFDLGDSFVSSETDIAKGDYAKTILTEFAMSTSRHHASDVLKTEEGNLKDLEKELSKLKKDNKDYHSTIEKAKSTISKNEKNVEINELDQKNKEKEIEAQIEVIKMSKENVKKFNN